MSVKVSIIGMGPGSPDYVLPLARQRIDACRVLAGSSRTLQLAQAPNKTNIVLKDFSSGLEAVLMQYRSEGLALLASGDALFYSVLECALRYLDSSQLDIIPGISSFQLLFSRIGISYHHAALMSLHGREDDPAALIRQHKTVFFLTGGQWTLQKLCSHLCSNGMAGCRMVAGIDLSYPSEKVLDATVLQIAQQELDAPLCSVVVFYA